MTSLDLPIGYVPLRGRWGSYAWHDAVHAIEEHLLDGAGIVPTRVERTAPEENAHTAPLHGGRGPVHVVPAPGPGPTSAERWAIRHYRRGGAMAGALVDRYLRVGRARPVRELGASVVARERAVRTPAIVAGVCSSDGAFYRCDLVTEFVPDATPLSAVLTPGAAIDSVSTALVAAGGLIRALGDARVHHVDFHAGNILIPRDPREAAWVLDLDRARILERDSAASARRMKERLVRSIAKSLGQELPMTVAQVHATIDSGLRS
ncbi:MAG: lipopolysaccharide kinase InaA family protein [Gemmatimonadota bacterium]